MGKKDFEMTWHDIEIGSIVTEAGNAAEYKTGDWRSQRPIFDKEKCVKCGICAKFCPEPCIVADDEGYRLAVVAIRRISSPFARCRPSFLSTPRAASTAAPATGFTPRPRGSCAGTPAATPAPPATPGSESPTASAGCSAACIRP